MATLDDIESRFGWQSEVRRAEVQSVGCLVDLARRAGAMRLILNGSFVTDTLEPNDVDCVLLIGPGFPRDHDAEAELVAGLPFLEIDLVQQDRFDDLVNSFFATDRLLVPKGMIEVIL